MSLTSMLEAGDGGKAIAQAAQVARVDVATARRAIDALCPAIASQLQARAKDDPQLIEILADLLEDNTDASIAGSEAMHDGTAMLGKLYGSQKAARAALAPVVEDDMPAAAFGKLAAVSAVAVVAAASRHSAAMPLAGVQQAAASGSGGILGTILEAIIAGAIQGAVRQIKTRRRRTTSSSTRKRTTTSHRKKSPTRKRKTTSRSTSTRKNKTTARKRRTTSRTTTKALQEILGDLFGTNRKS